MRIFRLSIVTMAVGLWACSAKINPGIDARTDANPVGDAATGADVAPLQDAASIRDQHTDARVSPTLNWTVDPIEQGYGPQLAIAPDTGNMVVVWRGPLVDPEAYNAPFESAYYQADAQTWSKTKPVYPTALAWGSGTKYLAVSVLDSGDALMLGVQPGTKFNGGTDVIAYRYDATTKKWVEPTQMDVAIQNGPNVYSPRLQVPRDASIAVALWAEQAYPAGDNKSISSRRYDVSKKLWSDAQKLWPADGAPTDVKLDKLDLSSYMLNDQGAGMVVWSVRQKSTEGATYWQCTHTAQSGWAAPEQLGAYTDVRVAVDNNSNLFSAKFSALGDELTVARYDAQKKQWSDNTSVQKIPGDVLANLRVVTDHAGNATVIWQQGHGNVSYLWYVRYNAANGSWTKAAKIDPTATKGLNLTELAIATNKRGDVVIGWIDHDDTVADVKSADQVAVTIYDAKLSAWYSSVVRQGSQSSALNLVTNEVDGGHIVVLWSEPEYETSKIYAAHARLP